MFDSKVAREFPGGPVVRTLRSHWARVQSLPRELRSQKLCGAAKKNPKFFKKLKKKKRGGAKVPDGDAELWAGGDWKGVRSAAERGGI